MQREKTSLDKIDVVFTWCDGSDSFFQKQIEDTLREYDLSYDKNLHGRARFHDNDELKYSLRSIERYMPWVNHIYVVTNNQRPQWLAHHPRISVIDHREIMPNEMLPTFNSVMIEMYLHKIPGLSEKYIYFNDDVFVNAPLQPSYFFVNEKPVVRLTPDPKHLFIESQEHAETLLKSSRDYWFKSVIRAWLLAFRRYGRKELYRPSHVADAYTKTMVEKAFNLFPELLVLNGTPFRAETNVQRVILSLVMLYEYDAFLHVQREPGILYKLFLWKFKSIEWFSRTENLKTYKRVDLFKPKMFSINTAANTSVSMRKASKAFFEAHFPDKSSFEI